MSSVILTNWTVYYSTDTGAGGGMKQVRWTGGSTGSNTVNELYSALMHLFDNASQNDAADSIPIRAVTPTVYEIGSFDAGDRQPWFIDIDSVKHLTGGGLSSAGWARDLTARTASHGIVKITRSGTNIVTGDIGATITNSTNGDSGTLLYVSGTSLWIRPASSAIANDWDSSSGTITCNGHSDTQASAAISAKNIWTNIFTLGTIENDTEIYVYQNNSQITQWWSTGHLDALFLVHDFGTLIDSGMVTIFARQYFKLYDHFTVDASDGGRTPVPIATSNDANNTSGYRTFTGSSGSGTFNAGNYMYVGASWAAATKKGVLTAVGGSGAAPVLTYYLIGDLTDFASPDSVQEYDPVTGANGDATCTAGTPSNTGPAASPASTLTIGFAGIERDLNNGNGNRPYSVELDLQSSIGVDDLYERLKYLTRQGQVTDIDTETSQSIIGQAYTAIGDYYLPYDTGSVDNPFTEGETLTATGSFSCTLTSKHDQGSSEGFLIVRNVRGTVPPDNTTLTGGTSGHTALVDTNAGTDPVSAISPVKQSPFGTFAGDKFFGARGVWLANVPSSDATNYELIDSEGVRQVPPQTVALTVTGVVQNTQCYIADSVPNVYLNTTATSLVSGDTYQASTTITYSSDTAVTVRAREMGYLPFETTGTITTSGLTITAVWLVDPNWKLVVSGINISFTNPTTITRASGDFSVDGWLAIMGQVTVEGSATNDGTYEIGAVGTTTLTITGDTVNSAGAASGITLTFTRRSL